MKIKINNRDLYLRVLSLIIAIIFWLFAQQNMQVPNVTDKEQYQRIMKPLVFTDVSEGVLITSNTPEIFIELSGRFVEFNQKQDQILAYASLERKGPGRHSVKIEVRAPEGINVIQYYPDKLDVRLEKIETKDMVIQPNFIGALPENLAVENIKITPETVKVTGAQSLISTIEKAIVFLDLTKSKQGKYRDGLPIQFYAKDGKTVFGASTDPSFAEVTWEVLEKDSVKVPVVAKINKGKAIDINDLEISISPEKVTVFGSTRIESISTEPIDIDDLPYLGTALIESPPEIEVWPKVVEVQIRSKSGSKEEK